MMATPKDTAAATAAAAVLRQRILLGALKPGTPLRELSLIQELGISRNTLRQGFVQLTLEGLTEQQLYRGTVVRRMNVEDVRDIFTVRRTLELTAIDRSSFASPEAIRRMEDAVAGSAKAISREAWSEVATSSLEFHRAIVGFIESRRLDSLFEIVSAQLRLASAEFLNQGDYQRPWFPRDVEICKLLVGGQRSAARAAMERYLNDSEQILLDILRIENHRWSSADPLVEVSLDMSSAEHRG